MTFTVEDVERAFEAAAEEYDLDWGSLEYMGRSYAPFQADEFPQFGTLEFVEGYTGGEGGGSDAYVVFKLGDRYFKKEGYYASHYGTDWDGRLYEVEPYEKTVTFYRPVS